MTVTNTYAADPWLDVGRPLPVTFRPLVDINGLLVHSAIARELCVSRIGQHFTGRWL